MTACILKLMGWDYREESAAVNTVYCLLSAGAGDSKERT